MDSTILQQTIVKLVPEAVFNPNNQYIEAVVPADQIHQVAMALKADASTRFDFLFCQTGVDLKGELGVVYHLRSIQHGHSCVLKVFTSDRENPEFDSVSDIWKTAEYLEREIFDLFGIRFKNHPNLRRIFMEEGYKGFPLRKDFTDPINIIER